MEASPAQAEAGPPSSLPRFYPVVCCKTGRPPVYHGNQEALGWALDSVGRSVAFIGSGAFLGTALLELAKTAAGCEPDDNDCQGRVYGIRPSSLLTSYTIVVGLVSAALLPLIGAMVDYTPHRRLIGRIMSATFCILLFPQIWISQTTWFAVALLQIGVAFVGWAQTMVTYAYLPELTNDTDRLNQYTQSFTVISFGSMVVYLAGVVGISSLAGWDGSAVTVARFGTIVSFGIACVFLYGAWGPLLGKRPAARELPANQSLWTAGFIQVYRTSIYIYQHLPALKWFYIAISSIDAGVNSLATIMVTYFTDTLDLSSTENGIAFLSMLVGSIPGALIAGKMTTLFNPVRSDMLAVALLAVNTVVAAFVLNGPGQQIETYILTLIWGIGIGWKWTTDRLLASVLIPTGQDAEIMGIFLFAGQVFTWIPPLIFTALNEAGVSQSIGIGTLSIYFCIGLLALLQIGDYQTAITQVGRGFEAQNLVIPSESTEVPPDASACTPSATKRQ